MALVFFKHVRKKTRKKTKCGRYGDINLLFENCCVSLCQSYKKISQKTKETTAYFTGK